MYGHLSKQNTFLCDCFSILFFFSIFADSAEMPDGRAVDFASLRIFIIPWTNSSRGFCRREGGGEVGGSKKGLEPGGGSFPCF